MLLNELFLAERLTDVSVDVDYIYNLGFREPLEYIRKNRRIEPDTFKSFVISTGELTSADAVRAHAVNPCKIFIQEFSRSGSFYQPSSRVISMQTNHNAVRFVKFNCSGSLDTAVERLSDDQGRRLQTEFAESVAKGTIHHELAHWIDDSVNNRHIAKRIEVAQQQGQGLERGKPIDADHLEIQAQVHNVYQLKQEYQRVWDQLSFSEMIAFSPALSVINNSLTGADKIYWLKNLKARMAREGLLGRRMR